MPGPAAYTGEPFRGAVTFGAALVAAPALGRDEPHTQWLVWEAVC